MKNAYGILGGEGIGDPRYAGAAEKQGQKIAGLLGDHEAELARIRRDPNLTERGRREA